jgi:hypothetical protein
VDELELPAPETLHGRGESLETFEQEVALERKVAHFIAQDFFGNGLHNGVAATQREQTVVSFGNEFRSEEDLDVELKVHQIAHPAEDGVGPLLFQQGAAQMGDGACEKSGVALLFSDEEIDGTLVALQVFLRSDAAGVAAQAGAAAAFAKLEDGDGACERDAFVLGKMARSGRELQLVVKTGIGFEVGDPMLSVHGGMFWY